MPDEIELSPKEDALLNKTWDDYAKSPEGVKRIEKMKERRDAEVATEAKEINREK